MKSRSRWDRGSAAYLAEDAENGRWVDPSRHAPDLVLSLLSEALSTRTGRPIEALAKSSASVGLS